jgi:hypothetical protein
MVMILGGALVPVQAFLFPATAFASFVLLELGVAIVGLGAVASFRPRDRTAIGAALALVGGVSLAYGGGFVIGAILTSLGGVLLVDARDLSLRSPGAGSFTAAALGPPCPRCGRHTPTRTSTCPYRGFPDAE